MAGIANKRWKSELDTRTASELYHDGDKRGAALSLAKNINLFVIKGLDREAKRLSDNGAVYDEDIKYTNIVWEADKWREIVEQFEDYGNGEEWVEDDDFEYIAEQMYDLADSVGLWIRTS